MTSKNAVVGVTAFALVLIVGLLFMIPTADTAADESTRNALTGSTVQSHDPDSTVDPHHAPSERAEWEATVDKFTVAWGQGQVGKEQWLRGLKPYLGKDFYQMVAMVDADRLPYGTPVEMTVTSDTVLNVEFQVAYDSGETIAVSMPRAADGGWEIVNVVPVEEDAPTA